MSEDMSELIQKMNEMIKNDQIPENIKNIISGISSGNSSNEANSKSNTKKEEASLSGEASSNTQNYNFPDNNSNFSNNEARNSTENTTDFPNFDIGTILKMKSLMDNINQESNDPRANLLKSLKPYLRSSRKEKIDQYVQLFRMGKVFEIMNPLGGEKKNDV